MEKRGGNFRELWKYPAINLEDKERIVPEEKLGAVEPGKWALYSPGYSGG